MAADEIKSTSTVQQLVDPFGLLPPLTSQPYLFFKRGLLLSTATATFHLKVSKVSSYLQSPRSLFTVGNKNTSSDRITIFATMDTPDQPASDSDNIKVSSVTETVSPFFIQLRLPFSASSPYQPVAMWGSYRSLLHWAGTR
ncbi:hypothetical protein CCHR01_11609 [Colletotrichum chrysophilum]|uniref:Uncharacterized protein n=1 Tax=Colletotrichum chrysophilum TaxID=1836956 RepID=A0AAD9AEZ2_9PEZI|nr:hypothetical protein CCHR01_11609 [Colletotrichum chrysophilum]